MPRSKAPSPDPVLAARIGAHAQHAAHDPRETTSAARAKFLSRFEREVDPTGILEPAERARRAGHAKKVYFLRLSLRSAKVRRQRQEKKDKAS